MNDYRFSPADVFIDVTVTITGEIYVQTYPTPVLKVGDYWDDKKYRWITSNWVEVKGKHMSYWVQGSILDTENKREKKIEKAREFAVFWHEAKKNTVKIDLNE
jgi:hypothetical protein